jgi:CheY-like chemotaxis protein
MDKILLADDGQTIQKVITITLASGPYEIDIAQTQEQLWENLSAQKYSLLLLDIDLSDESTGYDLAKKVFETYPDIKIILLYGTFDTIDENKVREVGIHDRIVKPFDSSIFVEKVRKVISDSSVNEEVEIDQYDKTGDFNLDQWLVKDEGQKSTAFTDDLSSEENDSGETTQVIMENPIIKQDDVTNELSDWGISIPGVIGEGPGSSPTLPPIIAGEAVCVELSEKSIEMDSDDIEDYDDIEEIEEDAESLYPENDDLEYPEMDLAPAPKIASEEQSSEASKFENIKLSSKLIPMEELNLKKDDPKPDLEKEESTPTDLIEQLVQDRNDEEFWAIDEPNPDEIQEDVTSEFKISRDAGELKISKNKSSELEIEKKHEPRVDPTPIDPNLVDLVKQLVESAVKEALKESAEKVAWEVIPDLAENLIKQELNKISESIQDQ